MCASQVEDIAEIMDQQEARLDFVSVFDAVDLEVYLVFHASSPRFQLLTGLIYAARRFRMRTRERA
jgi:hypothetical protein